MPGTIPGGLSSQYDLVKTNAVRRVLLIEGVTNLGMFSAKISVGLATGSSVIIGDALHSLADLANNALAFEAERFASRPPDEDHPYGHRKYEQLAVFALAGLLALMAFELVLRAMQRFDETVDPSAWGLGVMAGVLAVNCALATWEGRRARQLGSDLLRADARHTAGDIGTTIVAIAGWQAASSGYLWVDPLAAIAVSFFVLYLSLGLFRTAIPILVDHTAMPPDLLRSVVERVEHVREVRRVRSRSVGDSEVADVVVVVEESLTAKQSHAVADEIERALAKELKIQDVSVHVEPA